MKKKLLHISFILAFLSLLSFQAAGQNWQYLTTPYLANNSSFSVYFYYPDLEFNAAGDAFVGYWEYNGTIHFASNSGGSWNQFPAPASGFTVNGLDIEVLNSDYYCAYSRVISTNMYVFVKKFDGTNWNQLGDSMLLGNSGSGGYFEFLLDNNGVPTILGAVSAVSMANKEMRQFNGTSWNITYTFPSSAASFFREGTAAFNSQNKLICATVGYYFTPSLTYYTMVNEIDGGQQTLIADTIFRQLSVNKIMLDGNDVTYLCANNALTNVNYTFKQNGANWDFIGDSISSGAVGSLLTADVSDNGVVIYNTLSGTLARSIFYFNNNTRTEMDSLNISGFSLGSVSEIVIPHGSSDVYALVIEVKSSAAQDISVLKHAIPPPNSINELQSKNSSYIFPNPLTTAGTIHINTNTIYKNATLTITNSLGQICRSQKVDSNDIPVERGNLKAGSYNFQIKLGNELITSGKILVQ